MLFCRLSEKKNIYITWEKNVFPVTQREARFYVTCPNCYNFCDIFGCGGKVNLKNWFIIISVLDVEELQ